LESFDPECGVQRRYQMSKIYDDLKRADQPRYGNNVVSSGLRVKGELSGDEDLLVDGNIEGQVQLGNGVLTIGAKGKIVADVMAREIVVYGDATGNLVAQDRIQIKKDGSVVGDLTTARIMIEDGAYFKGSIEIVRQTTDTAARQKSSQPVPATAAPADSQPH
jgi:cytoskeletal protein CcmA (bactofilin family)